MKGSLNNKHPFVLIILGGFFFLSGLIVLWLATLPLPDLNSFEQRKISQSTKIYDKTGEILLYDANRDLKRTVVSFDEISRYIKNATVAIEDAEFYEHRGIKPSAILRAILVNLRVIDGIIGQGGSTITQQVVKNSLLTSEKLISRKLKEWALALRIERILSKDEILAIYLNESPYGGTLYGVEEASRAFFGKSAAEVTLPEAAYLAALPQAPTYYSPHGNNRERLEERKNLVLEKMLENKFITKEEYEDARVAEVTFKTRPAVNIEAPHFVFYVLEQLEEKYGKRLVEDGGLRVVTTLDMDLQRKGEDIVKRYALENAEKFNAENAALVAIQPTSGAILTMVGSRDYFDDEIDGAYNVAVAKPGRQPGSAFKPFVYATAFKQGYTSETVVFDLKTQFSTTCPPQNLTSIGNCYSPGNYDNIFRGPITLRGALAQSVNIPAVKTLYLTGISNSLRTARDMGIQTLENTDRYGLTLVLGGGEVTPLDITSAYGVFANNGIRNEYYVIERIELPSGEILFEHSPNPEEVLEKNIAHMISDVLSDNVARAPAFGENSYLHFPNRAVAVKTGTTNDYKDAWIVGYTPDIAVGAWAGNNDNTPMEKRVAGFIIAPLWNAFMQEALPVYGTRNFTPPDPEDSQTLKPVLRNALHELPEVHSILHWVEKEDPRGAVPNAPEQDPQYQYWEYAVSEWLKTHSLPTTTNTQPQPTGGSVSGDVVVITTPRPNASYGASGVISTEISLTNRAMVSKVEYYVNGEFVNVSTSEPFSISFTPQSIPNISSRNTIEAVVYDKNGNFSRGSTTFDVAF